MTNNTNDLKNIKVTTKLHRYLMSMKLKYNKKTTQELLIFFIKERNDLKFRVFELEEELKSLKNGQNE